MATVDDVIFKNGLDETSVVTSVVTSIATSVVIQDETSGETPIERDFPILKHVMTTTSSYSSLKDSILKDNASYQKCLRRVGISYSYLQMVPEELLTIEMCKVAVRKDCAALHYVPRALLTEELFETALNSMSNSFLVIQFFPESFQTDDVYKRIVEAGSIGLSVIPKEKITLALCNIAVKSHGNALQFVPFELIDSQLCWNAVRQDGNAICYVPRNMRTPEMYCDAIKNDVEAIRFIPVEYQTDEIIKEVLKNGYNYLVVKYVYDIDGFKKRYNENDSVNASVGAREYDSINTTTNN
jgi:hypothetical protein